MQYVQCNMNENKNVFLYSTLGKFAVVAANKVQREELKRVQSKFKGEKEENSFPNYLQI